MGNGPWPSLRREPGTLEKASRHHPAGTRQDREDKASRAPPTDDMHDFMSSKDIKPLKKHQYQYRMRVGRYRVLFDV